MPVMRVAPEFDEFVSWFPTLRGLVYEEMSPDELAADIADHALSPAATSGSLAAAKFVLAVLTPDHDWGIGQFRPVDVLSWDGPHRAAFQRWAAHPWVY